MPQYVEKPIIDTISVNILSDLESAFIDWQAKLNGKIIDQPGFISLEFLSPSSKQKEWLIVQRFSSSELAEAWRGSLANKKLIEELKGFAVEGKIQQLTADESHFREGVTEVIVAEIHPEKAKTYRDWSAKIHQVEGKFPGFRGVYVQSPAEKKGKNWITLLQFDTMENLDHWLESSERQELIHEAKDFITSMETHRIMSPYAGWFANIAKVGEVPPVWKQTMLVLLTLFPIVMLEINYLSPFTSNLHISLATFIGNAISVSLVSFPMMPLAIWLLGWWLSPKNKNPLKSTLLGTLLLLVLYLIEIFLFWKFF